MERRGEGKEREKERNVRSWRRRREEESKREEEERAEYL